jgi:DNA-directed RNA polymerase omega subunit
MADDVLHQAAVDEREDGEPESPSPRPQVPPIESRFLFVDVAALRAKQLRRGARPRLDGEEPLPRKPERIAMEEVRRGLIPYELPATQGQSGV